MRTATWETVGKDVSKSKNINEVLSKSGLDYTVTKAPIFFDAALPEFEEDGTPKIKIPECIRPVPKKVVTFRTDTQQVKGIVGEDYQICQNRDAFDFVNNITEDMEFLRAGESGNGTSWIIAKFPQVEVLGDAISPHLIFQNGHNGSIGIKAAMCMLRLVCQNQFNAAFSEAANTISIRHIGDMDSKLTAARETITKTHDYIKHYRGTAEELASKKITNKMLQDIIRKMIADENEVEEDSLAFERIKYFHDCYNSDDNQNVKGTAWGVMNAYTDFLTHLPIGRKTKSIEDKHFIKTTLESKNCGRMLNLLENII